MNKGVGYSFVFGIMLGAIGMFVVMSSLVRSPKVVGQTDGKVEETEQVMAQESEKSLTEEVGWEKMKTLLFECKVKESKETHDGYLSFNLNDGAVVRTKDYSQEELYKEVADFSSRCGYQIPVALE